jgi:hypothetical protein
MLDDLAVLQPEEGDDSDLLCYGTADDKRGSGAAVLTNWFGENAMPKPCFTLPD